MTLALLCARLVLVSSLRAALFDGWCFGMGFFLAGVYWVYISVGVYGAGGVLGGVLVTFLFPAFLALFPAVVMGAAYSVGGKEALPRIVAFVAFWVVGEWVRSWLLTGFPWLLMGHALIDTPLAVYAPVGGTLLLSAWVGVMAASGVGLFLLRSPARWLLLLPVVLIGMGAAWIDPLQWSQAAGEPVTVGIVQGNFTQDLKWRPDMLDETIDRYVQLTSPLWGEVDFVVWPETAVPDFVHSVMEDLLIPLKKKAEQTGTTLILGIPYFDFDQSRYFNSVLSLGEHPGIYFKRHLVPFGEYLPFRKVFGQSLDFLGSPIGDFTPGEGRHVTVEVKGYPVALSVCFEIVPGNALRLDASQAAWLVNVSNDGWFGQSIAPYQHFQIARMRALENNRTLVRSTNTGITAVIEADGRVQSLLAPFAPGVLKATVLPRSGLTPYGKYGDAGVVIPLLLIVLGVMGWGFWQGVGKGNRVMGRVMGEKP
jgi:apolipoprotein N-acyltransferase